MDKYYTTQPEKNNTYDCIKYLKNEGYQIIATTPHKSDINLKDFETKNNKINYLNHRTLWIIKRALSLKIK